MPTSDSRGAGLFGREWRCSGDTGLWCIAGLFWLGGTPASLPGRPPGTWSSRGGGGNSGRLPPDTDISRHSSFFDSGCKQRHDRRLRFEVFIVWDLRFWLGEYSDSLHWHDPKTAFVDCGKRLALLLLVENSMPYYLLLSNSLLFSHSDTFYQLQQLCNIEL